MTGRIISEMNDKLGEGTVGRARWNVICVKSIM